MERKKYLKELNMRNSMTAIIGAIIVSIACSGLQAATYLVGPGKTYAKLQDVADLLEPGDVVQVDGNATYPSGAQVSRSGTADKRITINGITPAGGTRPKISGTATYGIDISSDYIVFEGFEVRGRPKGIGVFGDHILVRGCVIDSCNHGLIGYGTGTGNVTVEYCEFFGNGVPTGGATQHQIYMATDEKKHPGSIFRLQFCYLHDGVEGDNVKSRSERNEIYYNWIENAGSSGHGMGLFAPDPEDNDEVTIETAREDADVVGNVIIQPRNACARIGGDLEGYPTNGRYRFVNNTFILTGNRGDAIRTFNTIETVEMYNNVIYAAASGGDIRVVNDNDGAWVHSPRSVTGDKNWIVFGATMLPAVTEIGNIIRRSESPFVNVGARDLRPASNSLLINTGVSETPTIAVYPFPNPLFPPLFHPPMAALIDTGTEQQRSRENAIDIGAFEASSQTVTRQQPGRYNPTFTIRRNMDVSGISMFYLDGRSSQTGSCIRAGVRIMRLRSAEQIEIRRSVFIK
jgi:hypothetical protein